MATIYIRPGDYACRSLTAFRLLCKIRAHPRIINSEEPSIGVTGIRQPRPSMGSAREFMQASQTWRSSSSSSSAKQATRPGRDAAGRSACPDRDHDQTAHGSADVALASADDQATARRRDFRAARARRPPLRRPGMARESDLRLPASGLSDQRLPPPLVELMPAAEDKARTACASCHANFRLDGAIELRRDQSRVHQDGPGDPGPEHYRRHQQPARRPRERPDLDDRRVGLRGRPEHRDDRGRGDLRERTDPADPVFAADTGSRTRRC